MKPIDDVNSIKLNSTLIILTDTIFLLWSSASGDRRTILVVSNDLSYKTANTISIVDHFIVQHCKGFLSRTNDKLNGIIAP